MASRRRSGPARRSRRLRIAYVINSVEGGGAALPVPAIARVFGDAGAEVGVFALTRRDGRALPAMRAAGLDVAVRDGGERDHRAALRWLDAAVAAARPSHVWTSLTRATLLGQVVGGRQRLPVVSWQHNAFLKTGNRLLLRARQARSALWVGDSDAVTALTAVRLGVPAARLATWPIFAADPAAPQAVPWRPGETLRLGSLGRLHPAKGYDVLIAALARLGGSAPVPFEVTLAGDGGERARLAGMIAAAGLGNVGLAGYAERPRDFLGRLHLYLQPSRAEGFCIAAHEAMQAGLGVVASAVGELPSSLAGGGGVTVPPGDAAALAAALRTMLAAPERLAAYGAAARATVLDRFSPARFAAAGNAVLARLAALPAA